MKSKWTMIREIPLTLAPSLSPLSTGEGLASYVLMDTTPYSLLLIQCTIHRKSEKSSMPKYIHVHQKRTSFRNLLFLLGMFVGVAVNYFRNGQLMFRALQASRKFEA